MFNPKPVYALKNVMTNYRNLLPFLFNVSKHQLKKELQENIWTNTNEEISQFLAKISNKISNRRLPDLSKSNLRP